MDLKEIEILGDSVARHWYYRAKARAMGRFLCGLPVQRVLDVGAGSAYFSRWLLENQGAAEAWCVDTSYARDSEELVAGKPLRRMRSAAAVNADMVLLMDVLEHVDDDLGLLRQYAAIVPTGAHFLVTVPAFQLLWSAHDEFLEHRRRYTLKAIEGLMRRAGLSVARGGYVFGAVFPAVAAMRMAGRWAGTSQGPRSDLRAHSRAMNAALDMLCRLDEAVLLQRNRLAGLSVMCLAAKAS